MSTDIVPVAYDSEDTGLPLSGTLRFHNTSGMASWQPADVEETGKIIFYKRELVALAKAVLRHEGFPPASIPRDSEGGV